MGRLRANFARLGNPYAGLPPEEGACVTCFPLDLISITMHRATESAPSGGKVVRQHQKGCISASASEAVWFSIAQSGGFLVLS